MGLAHYGHIIYVEPERFLSKKNMKDYIEHSRRFGITVVGRKLQYSPFVVTHPEMYFFFNVDTRKLQRVNMFEVTMIIMHNSQPVRHEFMRYLVSCALEEYCIAPPGAQRRCDQRLYPGSKKYANCHRYDLSAVNILLDKWFDFKQDTFLVRDIATAHYNGKDVSSKVKTCSKAKEEMWPEARHQLPSEHVERVPAMPMERVPTMPMERVSAPTTGTCSSAQLKCANRAVRIMSPGALRQLMTT